LKFNGGKDMAKRIILDVAIICILMAIITAILGMTDFALFLVTLPIAVFASCMHIKFLIWIITRIPGRTKR